MIRLSTQERNSLIRLASSLPKGDETRRAILRNVYAATKAEFLKEKGDQKVRDPDTGNEVKLRSLRGPKGLQLIEDKMKVWLKGWKRDQDDDTKRDTYFREMREKEQGKKKPSDEGNEKKKETDEEREAREEYEEHEKSMSGRGPGGKNRHKKKSSFRSSDRESLIRLASALPKGDETRRAILSGLKNAAEDKKIPSAFARILGDMKD